MPVTLGVGNYGVAVLDSNNNPQTQYSGMLVVNSSGVTTYSPGSPNSANSVTNFNGQSGSVGWTCSTPAFPFSAVFSGGVITPAAGTTPMTVTGGTVSINGTTYYWQIYMQLPTGHNYQISINGSDTLGGTLNLSNNKYQGQAVSNLDLIDGQVGFSVTVSGTIFTFSNGICYSYTPGGSSNQKWGVTNGIVSPLPDSTDGAWMADSVS